MKQTIVSHIGITRMGILEIQMRKQLVDGDQTHELGFHRVSAAPGADLEQVLAAVNADLTRMGMAEITTEEWDDVRATSAVAWTGRAGPNAASSRPGWCCTRAASPKWWPRWPKWVCRASMAW